MSFPNIIFFKKLFLISFIKVKKHFCDLGTRIIRNDKLAKLILIIVITLTLLLMFFLTQFYIDGRVDDHLYSYIWGTNQKITNIFDIFLSQYRHYLTWGGRCVAHFIVQTLLLIGKPLSSIVTAIMYVLLSYLIYRNICKNKNLTLPVYFSIISLLYLLNPNVTDTIKWITGAGNYLYTLVLVFLFLIPYISFLNNKKGKYSSVLSYILFVFGIFVGWTNENTSAALIGGLIIIIGYLKVNNEKFKLPKWYLFGLLGLIIGFLIMIAAPGNSVRSIEQMSKYGSIFIAILSRLYQMERALTNYLFPVSFLCIFSISLCIYYKKFFSEVEILFLIMTILSYLVMICSPTMPDRAFYCTTVFAITFCLNVFFDLIKQNRILILISLYLSIYLYFCFFMQVVTDILLPFFK